MLGAPGESAAAFDRRRIPPAGVAHLALAAGNFLYVAMADLIPGLHRGAIDVGAVRQVLLIAAGIGTVLML